MRIHRCFALASLLTAPAAAQNPLRHFTDAVQVRFGRTQPVVHYQLTIAEGDTTGWDVRIAVRNAPDTFRLAMVRHPEYDDRFFRFVQNLRVDPPASITQRDSAVWRVVSRGGAATISYRIQLPPPPPQRAAWRPFLSATGGLTGGPHAFMYVLGAELAPSHVEVRLPDGWGVATGLARTSHPGTFFAASVYDLVESPLLVGRFQSSSFAIDGVPHIVTYWPLPTAASFDTATFRRGVERLANAAVALFGRPPYREYVFQFQDGAFGALEHYNSVSLGAPSAELARNPYFSLQETAHEFIHTWNLVRIRPVEYVGVSHETIKPVPTLWFSEGLTMFYADLLLRRAGLPAFDSSRVAHLERLIMRYVGQPGNARFSPEHVSRVAYNARPDALGDYDASTHLQGELLGTVLDLMIRDATNGRRSSDDLMRLMLERHSGAGGFTGADIERAVADVCSCDARPFFAAHVRGAQPIPFDRYLGLIGLQLTVTRGPALQDGQPAPDVRIRAWNPPGDSALSLLLGNPESVWGKAGLHSRDRLVSVNGSAPRTSPEFRQILSRARLGDTVRFVVQSQGAPTSRTVNVVVAGYDRPVVRIQPVASVTEKQRRLRDAWLQGLP